MAKEKAPAFQFYPDDWQNDEHVRVMTLEEKGAYIELLSTCWREQTIPTDTKRIARLLGVSPRKAKALWGVLSPRFDAPNGDGRCTHPRLERERQKQSDYRSQKIDAGRNGAKKRWRRDGERHRPATVSPSVSPLAKHGSPSPISSLQSPVSTHTEARVGKFFAWWEWDAYPKHRGVRYCPTPNCFDNAKFLVAHYDDSALLQQICEVFLQIPDDAEPWLKGKTRTLGMLRSKASAIEERLKARAHG